MPVAAAVAVAVAGEALALVLALVLALALVRPLGTRCHRRACTYLASNLWSRTWYFRGSKPH